MKDILKLAKELALSLEADKHRDQPELLEVQLLSAIEEEEEVVTCAKCGGCNVQHAMWVNLNTGEVLDEFGTWCSGDNSWCDDCGEHTALKDPNG